MKPALRCGGHGPEAARTGDEANQAELPAPRLRRRAGRRPMTDYTAAVAEARRLGHVIETSEAAAEQAK
jgi:hypothetical protein